MADFSIKPGQTVWLHHKPWRTGQEDALVAEGFSEEQRSEQLRRGAIVDNRADVNATPAAIELARPHKIDLGQLNGSGADGRIIKRDVQDILDARADLESEDDAE